MHNQIPFSTHGSNCANRALAMGVNVANAAEATLHLLSAIATATLGVDVRNAFRMEAGAERPNDHLEETQTFATEADVDSVSGTISSQSIHQAVLSSSTTTISTSSSVPAAGWASIGTCWKASPSISFARHRNRC